MTSIWRSTRWRWIAGLALACGAMPAAAVHAQEGTVIGRLVDDRGAAAAYVEVHGQRDGRRIARAVTDGQGNYRMAVTPGPIRIVVVDGFGILPAESAETQVPVDDWVRVDLAVRRMVVNLEQVIVTGTGSPEGQTLGSVGGMVTDVDREQIRSTLTVTPTDVVARQPGVDFTPTGVGGRVMTFRGNGNIFSGNVRYLVDYRQASLASLRANFPHFVPTLGADMERIEIILGPSSAIYGPNAANGVMNVLTRSPLDLPESSVSMSLGSQDVFITEVRSSQRLGEQLGLKVSGRWFGATEYRYDDPVEQTTRALVDSDPDAFRARLLDIGVADPEIALRERRVGIRDRDIRRWSADARLDWTPTPGDTLFLQAGRTTTSGIEVTPIGAAQAGDWGYEYVQGRFHSGSLFAMAYMNRSDAGDTFLLRDGAPLIDDSRMLGLQARHGFSFGDGVEEITYGADWTRTTPETGGTIHGEFEDDDEITEYGGYVQSRTRLLDGLHLVGTLRVDESNVIDDPVLSPRVGVVIEPADGQSFSASWSRGFATPTPTNYFLDISAGSASGEVGQLGYRVRARGTGRTGIRFSDGQGGYQGMRSPCTPQAAGGPSALIAATSENVWQCAVGIMEATGAVDAATAGYLRTLSPDITLNAIDPVSQAATPLTPGAVADIAPLVENTTSTFELGYRGLIANRMFLQAAAWRTRRDNFASPLTPRTPLLTLDGPELHAYLTAQGMPAADAQSITAGAASIPGGVLSSSDIQATGAEIVATYENYGTLSYWGVDLGADMQLTRSLTLTASGSYVSDDYFEVEGRVIPLNAPELKGSAALSLSHLPVPLSARLGVRGHSGFPVSSGDFEGMSCVPVEGEFSGECVESVTLLDASVGYDGILGPDVSVRVSVSNLLDTPYRPFVGVPTSGRQLLTRLEYRLR